MRLKLVKQGKFLGTVCDFYVDEEKNIYMSRTQIGYALKYKQPQHAILVMHQRHRERLDRFSVEVKGSQFVTPYFAIKIKSRVFSCTRSKGILLGVSLVKPKDCR